MPFNTTSCALLYHTMRHAKPDSSVFQPCYYPLQVSDAFLVWLIEAKQRHPQIRTEILEELLELNLETRRPQTNRFYQALGLNPPTLVVDSHSRNGCVSADLNEDLRSQGLTHPPFDLIINNGTTEHIFDQRMVFSNLHNLCKTGGIMYHKTPIYNVMNISLYGNQPRFFHDIAIANDYQILGIYIANRWGDHVPVDLGPGTIEPKELFQPLLPSRVGHVRGIGIESPDADTLIPRERSPSNCTLPYSLTLEEYMMKAPLDAPDNRLAEVCNALANRSKYFRAGNGGELYNLFILKKRHDEPFQVPYQGNNVKDIESAEMKKRYQRQIDYYQARA